MCREFFARAANTTASLSTLIEANFVNMESQSAIYLTKLNHIVWQPLFTRYSLNALPQLSNLARQVITTLTDTIAKIMTYVFLSSRK